MSLSIKERLNDFITGENTHVKKALLSEYSDMPIKNIFICKKPVEKELLQIIKTISTPFNELLKDPRYSYDRIMHLYIIIELVDDLGKSHYIRFEKNPRIVFLYSDDFKPQTKDYYQIKSSNFKQPVLFGDLIKNTMQNMGNKWNDYDPLINNCQHFILNVINSYFNLMHLQTPEAYKNYILQPINDYFKQNFDFDLSKSLTGKALKLISHDLGSKIKSLVGGDIVHVAGSWTDLFDPKHSAEWLQKNIVPIAQQIAKNSGGSLFDFFSQKNVGNWLQKNIVPIAQQIAKNSQGGFLGNTWGEVANNFKRFFGGDYTNVINIPLSDDDIRNFFHGDIAIVNYNDLNKYNNINQILDLNKNGVVILVPMTDLNRGHWVGLCKRDNIIYFFDSYGDKIEDELKHSKLNLKPGNLLIPLLKSNYDIHYNEHKLQSDGPDIQTCGRWVCCFIASNMSTDEFYNYIIQLQNKYDNVPLDYLICYLYDILKK
jgi:hypothetical protein